MVVYYKKNLSSYWGSISLRYKLSSWLSYVNGGIYLVCVCVYEFVKSGLYPRSLFLLVHVFWLVKSLLKEEEREK